MLIIPLSGTIGAGEYAVLERTDDETAPGAAFLIYTGALANTGATLTLYREDAGIEDRVIGGENWGNIGGDNASKDTPQRSGSGWITAAPTPGEAAAENAHESGSEDEDAAFQKTAAKKTSDPETIELKLPDTELSLAIGAPQIGYVGESVAFSAEPSGIGESALQSLQYEWNFGDLTTGSGIHPQHVFSYPGEYAVTLYASYARHEQATQKKITILPVALSLERSPEGELLIHNNDQYEVDVSNYRVKGATETVFPPRSVLLPHATVALAGMPGSILLLNAQRQVIASYPPSGEVAAEVPEPHKGVAAPISPSAQASAPLREMVSASEPSAFSFSASGTPSAAYRSATASTPVLAPVATPTEQLAATAKAPNAPVSWPYIALAGIICAGIIGIFATAKRVR
jgi:PKD repeat protein